MNTDTIIQLYAKALRGGALRGGHLEIIAECWQRLKLEATELRTEIEAYKAALNRDITESSKEKIKERISRYQSELSVINDLLYNDLL